MSSYTLGTVFNDMDLDYSTKTFAAYLLMNKLTDQCIDLRSLNGSFSNKNVDLKFGFLTNQRLTSKQEHDIETFMCRDAEHSCKVTFKTQRFQVSDLKITAYTDKEDCGCSVNVNRPTLVGSLSAFSRLPTFSNACTTGVDSDSWNNAASTKESRKLLNDIGIDVTKVRDLWMGNNRDQEVWAFGFPSN